MALTVTLLLGLAISANQALVQVSSFEQSKG